MMKVTITVVFLCICAALLSMSHAKKKKKNKWSAIKDTISSLANKIEELEKEIKNVKETCGCVSGCPDGWSDFQDSCLHFVETRMSWNQAMLYCQSLVEGGHLAEVYSEEKDMFLVDLMSRYGGDNKFEFGAWLGATDNTTEGQWVWTYSGETASYQNWFEASGEPNGGAEENCLHYLLLSSEGWNDASCTDWDFPSICEVAKPT